MKIERCMFSSRIKDSAAAATTADNRGAMAPPTQYSAAASWETMATAAMIKTMTTTIALPAKIESMGATVLVPQLAPRVFYVIVVVTTLSYAICKRANTCAFERHQHANGLAVVLG